MARPGVMATLSWSQQPLKRWEIVYLLNGFHRIIDLLKYGDMQIGEAIYRSV